MQSIIATFNDSPHAKKAIEKLVQQGFDRSSIHLQSAYENTPAPTPSRPSLLDPFGFAGVFSALFGPGSNSEAGKYAEAVRRGNSVVVFDAEDAQLEKAVGLMHDLGAVDIDNHAARWKSKGWTGFDAESKPLSKEELAAEREEVMPVVQEELQVGKRSVQGGGVRVVKRVTETPVSEAITLREEHASVVRRPVDRPATESDFDNFKEGVVEVLEMSEEAVVAKSARIVEEVVVRKDVTERSETFSDTVRRTDIDIERVPANKPIALRAENPVVHQP